MSAPASKQSGAGTRPIGTAGSTGSAKKKPTKKSEQPTTASSSSSGSKKDHISAASAADAAAAAKNASLTEQATASAYPLMNTPYNPEDDVDEDVSEETLKAQMADLLKEEEQAPRALTLELIRQRTLARDVLESSNQDLISKKLFQLERIYLDGLSLNSIDDCFDLFSKSLTHLYLQRNLLTTTAGFSALKNLQFLMLADNAIREVEGIGQLEKLIFLDLSNNLIEMLDTGSDDTECQLPESLVVLHLAGNPFTEGADHIEHIVTVSPYLKTLDGQRITNAMRRGFGLEASDDEEEPLPTSSATLPEDEDDEDAESEEDEEAAASAARAGAEALRAQTEEMRKRSQQRTMVYDTMHNVTQATTEQDRKAAIEAIKPEDLQAGPSSKPAPK